MSHMDDNKAEAPQTEQQATQSPALDRPKGLPVAEVCEDVGRKWARMLTDLPPGTMLYAAAQARSPAQRENTQINELLAQYEEECCDFTNLQWVVEASRRNVTTMPDSQVRCLLHTLAEHVAFKAPAVGDDPDGEAFRTAARLGLTLRFDGGVAQSATPGTPSTYEVVNKQDRAAGMRQAVIQAAAVIAAGGMSPNDSLAKLAAVARQTKEQP